MEEEIVDIVDESDQVIGQATRKEAHRRGLLHRVSVVYVLNDKGYVLLQQRSDNGKYDHSAAGHVSVGEGYRDAAERELFEEIGIQNALLTKIGTITSIAKRKDSIRRHILTVYVCHGEPGAIDTKEVQSISWVDPKTLFDAMRRSPEHYTETLRASIETFCSPEGNFIVLNE